MTKVATCEKECLFFLFQGIQIECIRYIYIYIYIYPTFISFVSLLIFGVTNISFLKKSDIV